VPREFVLRISFALWACAAISMAVMIKHFVVLCIEYGRVRQTGEVTDLPRAYRGLPVAVIVRNILPNVDRDRRGLIRAFAAFVAFALAFVAVIEIFAPHGDLMKP
jgi:hypothetical protein